MIDTERLNAVAKDVADKISKFYHDSPVYAYCDFYNFDDQFNHAGKMPIAFICVGTADFDNPKFKTGFEWFAKKNGYEWEVHEWATAVSTNGSKLDLPKNCWLYKSTIFVNMPLDWLQKKVEIET